MGEIINLRRERKRRQRQEARDAADTNRVKHGRSKADRGADAKASQRRETDLDGKRLERPDDTD